MQISWTRIHQLEKQYGDSFFILDLSRFVQNYRSFLAAFTEIYSNTQLAYSYKTNYIPKLCQTVAGLGGLAEVVSALEYELAIRAGVLPSRIVFNGPYKTSRDIERALLAGGILNLDSEYEALIVKEIAEKNPDRRFSVGLRCNFSLDEVPVSRFGFDVESGELETVHKLLNTLPNCRVCGLHFHSSETRSVDSYAQRSEKIIASAKKLFQDERPAYIDIGGGYFGNMDPALAAQYEAPIPSFQDYARAIAPLFVRAYSDSPAPMLILEPGVAVTADIMQFAARVADVKKIRGRAYALVAGSAHNVKPSFHRKNLSARVYYRSSETSNKTPVDIVGYTCMENDVLLHAYEGPIHKGDYVFFDGVGAYTIVLSPPFIRPSPPIVSYCEETDQFELIKRRQTTDELMQTYIL